MGLEFVEFVIELEEKFGIEISDEVASTLTTPELVKAFILNQLLYADSAVCLSQRAFYRLRHALTEGGKISRHEIKPATLWKELAPRGSKRHAWWGNIQKSAGLPLPPLTKPRWIQVVEYAVCSILGLMILVAALKAGICPSVVLVVFAIFAWGLVRCGTSFFRTRFAASCPTVGAAARHIADNVPEWISSPCEKWTWQEVSQLVDESIRSVLGVEEFNDDSDFFRDLKVG